MTNRSHDFLLSNFTFQTIYRTFIDHLINFETLQILTQNCQFSNIICKSLQSQKSILIYLVKIKKLIRK